MAITIKRVAVGRSCTVDGELITSPTRQWTIDAGSADVGPLQILAALRSQESVYVGATYSAVTESDANILCNGIRLSCTEDDGQWECEATYGAWEQKNEDPLENEPRIQFGGVQREKRLEKDIDGNPIVNSAGDPFQQDTIRDDSRLTITVQRNEAYGDLSLFAQIRDKLNSTPFFGFDPGRVKAAPPEGVLKRHPKVTGQLYWEVTYRFDVALDDDDLGWDVEYLDAGYRKLDAGTKKDIIRSNKPVSDPIALDGNGDELGDTDDPVYLRFPIYAREDFAALLEFGT